MGLIALTLKKSKICLKKNISNKNIYRDLLLITKKKKNFLNHCREIYQNQLFLKKYFNFGKKENLILFKPYYKIYNENKGF